MEYRYRLIVPESMANAARESVGGLTPSGEWAEPDEWPPRNGAVMFDIFTADIGLMRRRRLEAELRRKAQALRANLTRSRVRTLYTPPN